MVGIGDNNDLHVVVMLFAWIPYYTEIKVPSKIMQILGGQGLGGHIICKSKAHPMAYVYVDFQWLPPAPTQKTHDRFFWYFDN